MRIDCRICHGKDLSLILKLAPTPIGDQFLKERFFQPLHPIDLYQCGDCGLAQLLYEIPPEEIYEDYIYLTGSSVGLQQHFARYAEDAIKHVGLRPGDIVVDIGSNDGTLLAEFKKRRMTVLGVEPSYEICRAALANKIPTVQGYFKKGLITKLKAQLITANNVVANINDLDSFMEGIVDLLDDGGTFIFESFYLGDVVKNMVFDFIYHEHLSAFSIKPVKRLLQRYGMQLYRVDHQPTKGGSIRYYCNRYYGKKTKTLDYDYGGADPELDPVEDDDVALYERQTYLDFAKRIEEEKEKTFEFCRKAKTEGKTIAAFGACISGTTLMYHFGLGPFIDFFIDDNPAKIGRYSPGLHLLVSDTRCLSVKKPDYVLALAWRFADDFQAAHPDIKLIRPLPCFSIS